MDRTKLANHVFLCADICLSAMATALASVAYTGDFRTNLWENGGAEGWNSDPRQRVYFHANYKEPPEIPLIWSQQLTDQTLGVALLSLIFCFSRLIMCLAGQMKPIFSAGYDSALLIFWLINISGQMSGDFTDPNHPSTHPWYLARSCEAASKEMAAACRISQAIFVLAILLALLYAGRLALTAFQAVQECSGRPGQAGYSRVLVKLDLVDDDDEGSSRSGIEDERERYLYREALSPVLAFFPEDVR